jgi:hypothetical protein
MLRLAVHVQAALRAAMQAYVPMRQFGNAWLAQSVQSPELNRRRGQETKGLDTDFAERYADRERDPWVAESDLAVT